MRAAQPRQLRARALRPLRRRRLGAGPAPSFQPLEGLRDLWRSRAFEPARLVGSGSERLRAFHEQYGDDVLAAARTGDIDGAAAALSGWIEQNPPRPGDAWHPYTISTRAGNWIAALSLAPELETPQARESLWRQLVVLSRNVEDDILGNHVIRNARALLLGGAAFGSSELLERGQALLERELSEQVLPDGGHYERSPVYHLVVLRDLLEVAQLAPVDDTVRRMRRFAAALARPDGAPALFNDGGLDLAPGLELPAPAAGLTLFPETGYAIIRSDRVWLAFDCGPPSPSFLPAHAHADTLSLQLWVDGQPVLADPGTSTYEPGRERDWDRGTRAHSTVAVDGDQFQLWGAFRSGPLPHVELLDATAEALEAAVTGRSGVRHVRRLELREAELVVLDRLEGSGHRAIESALQFSPGVEPRGEARKARAKPEQRRVSERFFQKLPADALVVRDRRTLPAELGWTIPLR